MNNSVNDVQPTEKEKLKMENEEIELMNQNPWSLGRMFKITVTKNNYLKDFVLSTEIFKVIYETKYRYFCLYNDKLDTFTINKPETPHWDNRNIISYDDFKKKTYPELYGFVWWVYVPRKHTNIMKQILHDIPIKNQKDIEITKLKEEIRVNKQKIQSIKDNIDYYNTQLGRNQTSLNILIDKLEKLSPSIEEMVQVNNDQ